MTGFKTALRSSTAVPKPNPRVAAIMLLMEMAESDPSISGATLILPDGSIEFLDAARLREGGNA